MNGKYGPFILSGKDIVNIPANYKPEDLTAKDCKDIIEAHSKKDGKNVKKYVKKI
jgi:topoisomerase IA-like protein